MCVRGFQAAFSQIVTRHLGFVYTVCRRETGDAALAEDVAQVVFLILARKAPSLRVETTLSGWLFQTARFASQNARRREVSRKKQEQTMEDYFPLEDAPNNAVWDQIKPHYNAALAALSAKDREAVLLRSADGLSFPELSHALGTSEVMKSWQNRETSRSLLPTSKSKAFALARLLIGMECNYFKQNFPREWWQSQSHRLFQGMLIASEIRYTRYAPSEDTPVDAPNTKPRLPETVTDYHLQSASDVPVNAAQFNPARPASFPDTPA